MSSFKVAAYITSYEDVKPLRRCIASILRQSYSVSEILIIDNSLEPVFVADLSEKIVVQHFPDNIGISGGLRQGIDWARERKYDFLWTFDQDSEPDDDCLKQLIGEYLSLKKKGEAVGMVAPLPVDSNVHIELPGSIFKGYRFFRVPQPELPVYECDMAITSGALVSIGAATRSALPEIGLFIDAVDWDYCMKIKKGGYKIFMTRRATMQHRFSDMKIFRVPLIGIKIATNNYIPLRRYYMCRNHTYMSLQFAKTHNAPLVLMHRLVQLVCTSAKILLFEKDRKAQKIWFGVCGTFDGILGKLGKKEKRRLSLPFNWIG